MRVAGAYVLVVFIWSTTPLAIHFSNSSLSFVAAITVRMLLAFICCYACLALTRRPLIKTRHDVLVFAASAIGLFPNMLLVYWAAQHISSGLMSVIMGIYPFCVGLFSWLILKENPFTLTKAVALLIAVAGLTVIHLDQLALGRQAMLGVLAMLLVCLLWGVSSVLVKHLGENIEPLRQGTGSLFVSLPFFLAAWLIVDGEIPREVDYKSLMGVGYLVIAGSVVGHTLFFYVLRQCTVATVSLITLITPVMAITWGVLFADERLGLSTMVGAAMILGSLGIYQGLIQKLVAMVRRIDLRVRPDTVGAGAGAGATATATAGTGAVSTGGPGKSGAIGDPTGRALLPHVAVDAKRG